LSTVSIPLNMDEKTIKVNIQEERKKSGISQTAMANKLGMDRNTYHNIEKGSTRILNCHIRDIAAELGMTTERLLLGYDPLDPGKSPVLDDYRESYQSKYDDMVSTYEKKLQHQAKEIADLRDLVESLKGQVRDKETIISFLRSQSR